MTWDIIRLRLRALIADTSTTDGAERREPYAILATYSGHILLPLVCALVLEAWGIPAARALAYAFVGWVLAWEGRQYVSARLAGLSRWRVLRDWWLHDAVAYGWGLSVAAAVLLDLGPIWTTAAAVCASISAVAAAVIWGRAPEEMP